MRSKIAILCYQITALAAFIQSTGVQADERDRLYKSAYYLGRGDTGIAVADNYEAIFYNPAGLAQGKGIYKETVLASPMIEGSYATKDLARKIALEDSVSPETLAEEIGKNQHIGVYNFSGLVFRRLALGALVSNQTNLLPKLDATQHGLPVVSANTTTNQVMTMSLAEQYWGGAMCLGITGKYIYSRSTAEASIPLAEAESAISQLQDQHLLNTGTAGGADLGIMFRTSSKRAPFSLGLTIENVGGISFSGATPEDKLKRLPQMVNLGMAIEPGTQFSRIKLLMDVRDLEGNSDSSALKRIHIGTEISIGPLFGITAGFNQGYPTAGTYLNLYVVRVDIGSYTEEMGEKIGERPDQRFYLRVMAGF